MMFRFHFHPISTLALILFATSIIPCSAREVNSHSEKYPETKTGIDVLEEEHFSPLQGKRVGLITNQTGVDAEGRRTIDVLAHASGVTLVAIFSPEHGIEGRADSAVGNSIDSATGLPIYSLYGDTRRPTDAMLRGLDALVFDIQDAGVRFYTFTTTMAYCMEAAAKNHIEFLVLDRPDILGGEVIEGPMLDADRTSFVGYFPEPVRYAMTLGELARMFNVENKIGADLHVVEMKGWRRSETFDLTGLKWIPPSPNLRSVDADFLYPGIEILQAGDVSVGRGTDAPFQIIGAPWINAKALEAALKRWKMAGVRFRAAAFTPTSGLHHGELCQGVTIEIVDRDKIRSMKMCLEIAETLRRMYPKEFQIEKIIELLGSQTTLEQLEKEAPIESILKSWEPQLDRFWAMRAKYLIYP
jgi:uncharacterized protein YbbC (DUF1343 family)